MTIQGVCELPPGARESYFHTHLNTVCWQERPVDLLPVWGHKFRHGQWFLLKAKIWQITLFALVMDHIFGLTVISSLLTEINTLILQCFYISMYGVNPVGLGANSCSPHLYTFSPLLLTSLHCSSFSLSLQLLIWSLFYLSSSLSPVLLSSHLILSFLLSSPHRLLSSLHQSAHTLVSLDSPSPPTGLSHLCCLLSSFIKTKT